MSLRTRLNLLIAVLTLASLLVGLWIIVHNARMAVEAELTSASDLTVQLLKASLDTLESTNDGPVGHQDLLDRIAGLGAHRHIRLELFEGSTPPPATAAAAPRKPNTPGWFASAVKPPVSSFYRTVPLTLDERTWVVVNAEPADEITEAWKGSRGLLAVLVGFAVVANVLVHLSLGRALRPLRQILSGLDRLEHGEYASRLPRFSVPEFDSVSNQFNRLSSALEQSRESNRRLNRRILEIQEAERRHLARELHDEMGQCLTAIRAEAVAISRATAGHDEKLRESAEAISQTAGQVYGMTQTMIRRLHPAALDELGLALGLRQMVIEWAERQPALYCHCDIPDDLGTIEPDLAINLYRVVQECLTNVARHAQASSVEVHVRRRRGIIGLRIADNGRGFDTEQAAGGFGLLGIRERIAGLGGQLEVKSLTDGGTAVTLVVPDNTESVIETAELERLLADKKWLFPEPKMRPGNPRRRDGTEEAPSGAQPHGGHS